MIELHESTAEQIADLMNLFPEVRWDRVSGVRERFFVYGWLDREDGRADFANLILELHDDDSLTHQFQTSSAERSEEFCRRLELYCGAEPDSPSDHAPCQRVEDLFGDLVPGAIALTEENPAELGGDLVKTGDAVTDISTDRAVLVDAIAVSLLTLEQRGDPDVVELAVGILLEGAVNNAEPAQRAKVLNLLGWPEVAGLIVELEALAEREGQSVSDELRAQIDRYRRSEGSAR
jgi:hypothetical protein